MQQTPEDLQFMKILLETLKTFDRFTIKMHLNRFSVDSSGSEETESLRLVLKKAVLEELLKDSENELYRTTLTETLSALALSNSEAGGYPCCLVGCRYKGERHRSYIVHLKKNHPNIKNPMCNYKKECRRTFASVETLIQHLKDSHSSTSTASLNPAPSIPIQVPIPCKCNRLSCGGSHFDSVSLLMTHWNTFHNSENRDCIFLNCETTFTQSSMSRNHFRVKHKNTGQMALKQRHLISVSLPQPPLSPSNSRLDQGFLDTSCLSEETSQHDEFEYNDADMEVIENAEDEELNEEYYLLYYADFLNRLGHYNHIPQTTVQEISEEYLMNTQKSMENRKKILRRSLCKTNMSQAEIEKLVNEVENDSFLKAQLKLDTEFKRLKYIKENMKYVGPEEVVLNKEGIRRGEKKESYHYVSLVETFRNIIEDPSFIKMKTLKVQENIEDKLIDFKDGSSYKENSFFKSNPESYAAILYSDALEVKNPLGAARGSYKVVQVFLTLADINKSQRSKVDRLQLVMVKSY